jgi:voltage-gated potassium channel Kch
LSANFEAKKREHIVIDHNPALIDYFELIKKSYIFADATSVDIYKKLFHKELKMVVTTINDLEDDLFIIEQVRSFDPAILIVVVSNYNHHALQLYDAGADYVIMPDFL